MQEVGDEVLLAKDVLRDLLEGSAKRLAQDRQLVYGEAEKRDTHLAAGVLSRAVLVLAAQVERTANERASPPDRLLPDRRRVLRGRKVYEGYRQCEVDGKGVQDALLSRSSSVAFLICPRKLDRSDMISVLCSPLMLVKYACACSSATPLPEVGWETTHGADLLISHVVDLLDEEHQSTVPTQELFHRRMRRQSRRFLVLRRLLWIDEQVDLEGCVSAPFELSRDG